VDLVLRGYGCRREVAEGPDQRPLSLAEHCVRLDPDSQIGPGRVVSLWGRRFRVSMASRCDGNNILSQALRYEVVPGAELSMRQLKANGWLVVWELVFLLLWLWRALSIPVSLSLQVFRAVWHLV
jgi:hypothetical protein